MSIEVPQQAKAPSSTIPRHSKKGEYFLHQILGYREAILSFTEENPNLPAPNRGIQVYSPPLTKGNEESNPLQETGFRAQAVSLTVPFLVLFNLKQ